jgi:hypothetical protein
LVAGGAAFAGFKAFEDHQRKEGKPVSHQFAKELLAGFAGAEVDKIVRNTHTLFYDKDILTGNRQRQRARIGSIVRKPSVRPRSRPSRCTMSTT